MPQHILVCDHHTLINLAYNLKSPLVTRNFPQGRVVSGGNFDQDWRVIYIDSTENSCSR